MSQAVNAGTFYTGRRGDGLRRLLAAAMVPATFSTSALGAEAVRSCLPAVSVPIAVRIGDATPVAALLEGGIETPLSLFAADSRQLLWSAGAQSSATQVFTDMDAAFFGSLTAVDLDSDGLHDRIYAGDIAGRIWRFDLHHGAPAAKWASGGLFADFSNPEGRGFLAAPDVSLSAPPGASPWLNIAIGTAAPGNAAANNRFYALRDHAVHDVWTDEDYEEWRPWREKDLLRINATTQAAADAPALVDATGPGWYVELGSGHVVTPTLTVNDRAVLAIAAVLPRGGPCEVFTRIASFDLAQQRIVVPPDGGDWRPPLPVPVALGADFQVAPVAGEAIAHCTLGDQRVTDCDVDTRPRRTWWRREDAE